MKMFKTHVAALCLTLAVFATPAMAQFESQSQDALIDWPVKLDPELPVSQIVNAFDDRLAGLWFQALNQPDSRTRFEAAHAIAKAADKGMQGLEIMTTRLASLVESQKELYLTRLAAAKALIAMDEKAQASVLWQANTPARFDIVLLTDPALARWQYAPAIQGWRKRLTDGSLPLSVRISAAKALGVARDYESADALAKIAQDSAVPVSLRMEAARAYGSFAGELKNTKQLSLPAKANFTDKLVAVNLLEAHQGDAANRQMAKLAADAEPVIAALAGQWLLESSPASLDALLEKYSKSDDIKLREIAIKRYAQQADAKSPSALAAFFSDQDPSLRVLARDQVIALAAKPELRQPAADALLKAMATSAENVQEQAALGVGAVDVKEAWPRLLELLESKNPRVTLAAAASLRKLQVADTLEPALVYVQSHISIKTPYDQNPVAAQLIQLFGLTKYQPAEATLLKLVPKNSGPSAQRVAAIWTLGKLHEGTPDVKLIRDLVRRANDGAGMEPEDQNVREQAVIAIGRMKDNRSLKTFLRWIDSKDDGSLATAARWAVGNTTGQRPPEPPASPSMVTGWFLEPSN